jgi:predicted DNA-binding transcriptional regulator YafY
LWSRDLGLSAARGKIVASMSEGAQRQALHAVGRAYRYMPKKPAPASLALLREAAWDEVAVEIAYRDRTGGDSLRRIWPLAVVATESGLSCLAWCRLREGFRTFRLDSIASATKCRESFRPRRVALLREHLALLAAEGAIGTKPDDVRVRPL